MSESITAPPVPVGAAYRLGLSASESLANELLVSALLCPFSPSMIVHVGVTAVVRDFHLARRHHLESLPGTPRREVPVLRQCPRHEQAVVTPADAVLDGEVHLLHPRLGEVADPQPRVDGQALVLLGT